MQVSLVQLNTALGESMYLPYSVALLQAYTERHARRPERYAFGLPMARWRLAFHTYVLKPTMSVRESASAPRRTSGQCTIGSPKAYRSGRRACRSVYACNSATEYGRYIDSPSAVLSCTSDTCTLLS